MKPTPSKLRRISPGGIALVLVLAIITLVTVLVIAFFSTVTSELTSSKAYAGGAQAKQLSDSVVQLVMAQVGKATASGPSTARLAWASQPGMIRTFDDTGNPGSFYKLYSSPQMIVDGSKFMTAPEAIPAYSEWSAKPSLYTDLNQPVLARDPAGAIVPDATDPNAKYTANYPILDPTAVGNVEGFNIFTGTPPTGYTAAPTGYAGTYPPVGSYNPVVSANPAPMPVKWLYVLQSGAFAVPTDVDAATKALNFQPGAAPTATDPIVGRVAFWTDDETCKLNINTASEGAAFDVPRATIKNEIDMVKSMPVQNEYQRMPGHPAMTCLSPALGWIAGLQHPITSADTTLFTAATYPVAKAYYDITPRVNYMSATGSGNADRSSQAGTMDMTNAYSNNGGNSYPVQPDGDRLYASLDELVFNSGASARQSNPQVQGAATSPVITKQALEQAKFFLTASSRAPETTLFNTPRIGLWPLQRTTTVRDPKDKLLEFCTELGVNSALNTPYRYHFQRYNEGNSIGWAPVKSWTGSPITQIPSCLSSTCDYTQIERNQQLYNYLRKLTSRNSPGYGGNFVTKWTQSGCDQVLTEMFDLIRSGLAQTPSGLAGANPVGGYEYPMPSDGAHAERFVAPITIDTTTTGGGPTKGFGRFHTVVQAAIVFYASASQNGTKSDGTSSPPDQSPYIPLQTTQMQAVLVLMPFQPMPGMWNWSPFCRYEIKFTGFNLNVNGGGGSSSFANASNRVSVRMGANAGIGCIFPLFGLWDAFQVGSSYAAGSANAVKKMNPGSSDEDNDYPFCTGLVAVPSPTAPATINTFNFSGGDLVLNIRSGAGPLASSEIYQTIRMNFPSLANLPVPQTITSATSQTWQQRIDGTGGVDFRGIIKEGDIVRAVEVNPAIRSKGDWRVIAGMPNVPTDYFHPHPEYDLTLPPSSASAPYLPYTSTQLDYATSVTSANLSGANMNALAAARFGRYAHSLRSTGFSDGSYQYGIGNGAKNVGGANNTNRNNNSGSPYTGDKINQQPTTASTLQGSGFTTIGIPNAGGLVAGVTYSNNDTPVAAHGTTAALMSNGSPGDWDSGAGGCPDGPYVNKPDPGNLNIGANGYGYWTTTTSNGDNGAAYSPNRQVASGVMFGSLPTPASNGILAPWQTLLFCPNPASGGSTMTDHYGFGTPKSIPPDYLMLDLFTMPVVEPYAISEPLSTAGKVNLNYQIEPFSFIRRDTAVRGVLKSMQIGAIANTVTGHTVSAETRYKLLNTGDTTVTSGPNSTVQTRFNLNLDETNGTLAGFENKFSANDIFRSAAEVCSVFLVPMGPRVSGSATYTNVSDVKNGWWKGYKLTGDNLREAPYNQIYPRVTTKSNTFTVHYRVQVLQKVLSTPVSGWVESKDQVLSEYRGSTLIERYVDPADPKLPDFANDPTNTLTLDNYYQMRIISNKKF